MAHKFVSSKRCTRKASEASCSACIACDCHRRSVSSDCVSSMAISLTCFVCVSMRRKLDTDVYGHILIAQKAASVAANLCSSDTVLFPSKQQCQAYTVSSCHVPQDPPLFLRLALYDQLSASIVEYHVRRVLVLLGCFPDTAPELLLLDASALLTPPLGLFPPRDGPCTLFCLGGI